MPTPATIQVECPLCGRWGVAAYRLLGQSTACAGCGREIIPRVPDGTVYPDTGRELTFGDFRQLLAQDTRTAGIRRLLREWFGYRVRRRGGACKVVDDARATVDLLALHLRIQDDETRQRALYNSAMSLWR
jgi:hypothetical protein